MGVDLPKFCRNVRKTETMIGGQKRATCQHNAGSVPMIGVDLQLEESRPMQANLPRGITFVSSC